MLGILGNIKEYFWGSREHAVEFLGTGKLNKVNLREHLNLFLGNKGETPIFSREQGNMHPPPPLPGRPSSLYLNFLLTMSRRKVLITNT